MWVILRRSLRGAQPLLRYWDLSTFTTDVFDPGFIAVYLKQNPTPRLPGRLFGMRQPKATPWIHVLLPALRHTLRAGRDVPSQLISLVMVMGEARLDHRAEHRLSDHDYLIQCLVFERADG